PERPAVAPQVHVSPVASSTFDSYRYRDALKNISRLLGERHDERTLLAEFSRFVRELLGVGKLAVFLRQDKGDVFGRSAAPAGNQFALASGVGIAPEVVEHLRLTLDAGIANYLASTATILRRVRQSDPYALDYDPQIAREF